MVKWLLKRPLYPWNAYVIIIIIIIIIIIDLILTTPFKSFSYSDMCYAKQKPTPKKFNNLPTQRT